MKTNYSGKLALITGGSSGIGLAVARSLVLSGAHVWLLARREQLLRQAVAELTAIAHSTQRIGFTAVDVSDTSAVRQAVDAVCQDAGVPDVLVNSAGIVQPGYFHELDLGVFQEMVNVNYIGSVNVTRQVVPAMIARGSGQIILISSIAGFIGVFGYTAYGASKFALRGFSDALRAELKPYGIQVSIVFPPDTDTPQLSYDTQARPFETNALAGFRTFSPEKVAQKILKDARRGRYLILPGIETKILYWLNNLLGPAVYPIMDLLIRVVQRNNGNLKKEEMEQGD